MSAPVQPESKPGIFTRLRTRYGWLDHVVRAYDQFDQRNGSFFAAGLSYYTLFALFPLLMVGFAGVGFMLASRPGLRDAIDDKVRATVSGAASHQLVDLINRAIDARASVGVIGLATAAWAGLSWMAHLRAALTDMWTQHPVDSPGFLRNKLSDLIAMLGTFLVILATVVLTALGQAEPMAAVLSWLRIPDFSALGGLLRGLSILVSALVSWLLFTWMIARLPRQDVDLAASARAGLVAAVAFELFKQVASIYLRVVLAGPAGRVFGPVLGLLIFAYVTSFLVLFSTAWAATASPDPRAVPVAPPAPAIISPRVQLDEGLSARQALAALATGAVGALAVSRLFRWRN